MPVISKFTVTNLFVAFIITCVLLLASQVQAYRNPAYETSALVSISNPVYTSKEPSQEEVLVLDEEESITEEQEWTLPSSGKILQKNFNSRSEGIGFWVSRDKNIRAVSAGQVIRTTNNNKWNNGRGNYVVINHSDGYQSIYMSLTDLEVNVGSRVEAGDVIGLAEVTQTHKEEPVMFFQLTQNDQLVDLWDLVPESETKETEVSLGWSFSTEEPKVEDEFYFIRPTEGTLTQGVHRWHVALDIANKVGTPIYSARSGVVSEMANNGSYNYGYGNYVIVDHGDGMKTLYAHNSNVYVSIGEEVTQGQVIAAMGSTGRSSGPHLHLEVRMNGVKQNPWNYMP